MSLYFDAADAPSKTDAAAKWKTFTNDALGNLTTVTEPDPCVTSNTLMTTYTYDWMKHVTGVSMPRPTTSWSGTTCSEPGGSTTQTRTFVYDSAGRQTSATNPENGTVTYAYNPDSTLQKKHDAKGQDTVYTYDTRQRVTLIQRYPTGSTHAEDPCGRVVYTYDTNPVNPSFSAYSYGRLTTAQYGCPVLQIIGGSWYGYTYPASYIDMYSYHPAGGVTAKQTIYYGIYIDPTYGVQNSATGSIEADYTYDSAGRVATLLNPATPLQTIISYDPYGYPIYGQCTQTYSYDSMGRPSGIGNSPAYTPCNDSWVQSVTYDFAGRMTAIQSLNPWTVSYPAGATYTSESRAYNVNGQLSAMNGIQYVYSATQNNGQITQAIDGISGETIAYQYDTLKRLVSAASTPTSGSTPTAWTQTYQYDGLGNLTGKVLGGTTSVIAVNATTNQLSGPAYDANGNLLTSAATMTYDVANRLTTATAIGGGIESYQYAPDNKRVLRTPPGSYMGYGPSEFTFYGGQGEKLGVFDVMPPDGYHPTGFWFQPKGMTLWFAGRKVEDYGGAGGGGLDNTVPMVQDRLGSNRNNGARYRPYGEEITSTANNQTKFGTYTRDSYTGLDYADQRFYASSYGRFNTPDPGASKAAKSDNPTSWNEYAYVKGDPVNLNDPHGLFDDEGNPDYCDIYPNDPVCGSYSPLPPNPPSGGPAPAPPSCSISLYGKPTPTRNSPAEHTYIDATINYSDGTSYTDIIEGGPILYLNGQGQPVGGNLPLPFGKLYGFQSPDIGALTGTNPQSPTNYEIGSPYTGVNACSDMTQIEIRTDLYDGGALALYNGVPSFFVPGWNSNSFAYTLLNSVGLAFSFGSLPTWTPGWGLAVPNLSGYLP